MADYLSVATKTVSRLVNAGKIPYIKLGDTRRARILFDPIEVVKHLTVPAKKPKK